MTTAPTSSVFGRGDMPRPAEIGRAEDLTVRAGSIVAAASSAQGLPAGVCATLESGVELHEYAARAVKQSVVGRGSADKVQVQHMVRAILGLDRLPAADEADALAVALCHSHQWPLAQRKQAALLAEARR